MSGFQTIFKISAIFCVSLPLSAPTLALAGDATEGQALVRQWCDDCHLSGGNTQASDVGPPFAQIANDAAYTDERLRGWLHDPHPPMPKFELDRRRIEDIIAYIRTLKR